MSDTKKEIPEGLWHLEPDDYVPKIVGEQFISGVKDPIDLVPIVNSLYEAGKGNRITKQNEIHVLSVENAAAVAERLDTKLPKEVLEIKGSASMKNRAFLNCLLATCPSDGSSSFNLKNYLEIGCHIGSTFISACWGNKPVISESYVIDKFRHELGENTEEEFKENCVKFLGYTPNLFSEDCFSIDIKKIKEKIDVYFFDGPHKVIDHELALTYYEPVFNDNIVVIIDDWNDHRVKLGTLRGLAKINYDVAWFHEMPAHQHISDWGWANIHRHRLCYENIPSLSGFGDPSRWWNGTLALVLSKKSV